MTRTVIVLSGKNREMFTIFGEKLMKNRNFESKNGDCRWSLSGMRYCRQGVESFERKVYKQFISGPTTVGPLYIISLWRIVCWNYFGVRVLWGTFDINGLASTLFTDIEELLIVIIRTSLPISSQGTHVVEYRNNSSLRRWCTDMPEKITIIIDGMAEALMLRQFTLMRHWLALSKVSRVLINHRP